MNNFSCRSITVCLAYCALSVAQAQINGQQVLDGLSVSPAEVGRLESGEILTFSDKAYETTKRELAADAMILVDTDLDAVMKALTEEATIVPSHYILEHAVIKSEADFSGVGFTDAEYDEVKNLFGARPGGDLNFSKGEFTALRQKLAPHGKSDRAGQIAAASAAMRDILIARYNAYRAKGLSGVEGYSRSKRKQIDIGSELRLTTETFKPFEGDFPDFYRVMHDYPAAAECCEHYFRWIKVRLRKRPTFTLVHTMIQKTDDYILATERYYYATSTLNSLQVTLSWLKYDADTYMGLAMSASTDILDSFLGRMLRPVGRNKAKDMVADIMHEVKADLEGDGEADDDTGE
jgi:hypothetical protein